MADKLTYNPNDDTQNHPFYRLELVLKRFKNQLFESFNQNSLEFPKLVNQ